MESIEYFIGYTLVDITETGVTKDRDTNYLARNQQRNWESVLQCIGLRAQPMNMVQSTKSADLDNYDFGEMYTGEQKVWSFAFTVEHQGVFERAGDSLALLNESFDQVPIISGLEETAKFILPIFYTSGAIKNIYFKIGTLMGK